MIWVDSRLSLGIIKELLNHDMRKNIDSRKFTENLFPCLNQVTCKLFNPCKQPACSCSDYAKYLLPLFFPSAVENYFFRKE